MVATGETTKFLIFFFSIKSIEFLSDSFIEIRTIGEPTVLTGVSRFNSDINGKMSLITMDPIREDLLVIGVKAKLVFVPNN